METICLSTFNMIPSRDISQGVVRIGALALIAVSGLMSSCSETPTGNIALNQTDGMVINPPEFLQGRAIVRSNLTARVVAVAEGVSYEAVQTNSISLPWIGQVYVPEGSNPTVTVTWVETGVPGLPGQYGDELPLAIATATMDSVITNQSMEITADSYQTEASGDVAYPQLDVDEDGASNFEERQAGSRPGDSADIPSAVLIHYSDRSPNIDGQYDSLWNTAQFRDQDLAELSINNLLLDTGLIDTSNDSEYRWAAMHDGSYLYLMIFGERGSNQTPTGDSGAVVYRDDSVDIYWDGDNSNGSEYDGVDDFHIIVGLLDENGSANRSTSNNARIQTGDRSAPTDLAAIQYAVCLCQGDQQIYEIRMDLAALRIPVDSTFGFELNINNDVDGGGRDTKWAWFNDTGRDETWQDPSLMGNVRLEAVP